MPQPAYVEDQTRELRAAYRAAWDEVEALELRIAHNPEYYRMRARLEAVRARIAELMDDVDKRTARWMQDRLPAIYQQGAAAATTSDFVWTQVHIAAVKQLATTFMDDMLTATRFVRADTKRFIREVTRERLFFKLTAGETARGTGRQIERILRERGISAITYADGSRHGLREYGEMVSRTTSANTYNIGGIKQMDEDGIEFCEILDGPGCGLVSHDDPTEANGMIVTLDESLEHSISHPNCRRSFAPRPDVGSKRQARSAERLVTEEQIADIRNTDLVRRELRRLARVRA